MSTRQNSKLRIFFLAVFFALIPLALSSGTITYQARVQDSAGNDIDGPVTVGFRIYGSSAGSTVLWGETQSLTANKGIISVELGKVNSLPDGLFNNPELYLGITVTGDSEMSPRRRLVSTWKAMSAQRASGKQVQAGGATLNVTDSSIASVAITFPEPFSSPPVVMLGASRDAIGAANFIPVQVTDVTITGCTAHFSSLGGVTATGSSDFDWIAVGE